MLDKIIRFIGIVCLIIFCIVIQYDRANLILRGILSGLSFLCFLYLGYKLIYNFCQKY